MKKTKVFVIQAKDEFELVKKMNQSDKDFFASQPIQKLDESWVCFIYFKSEVEK
jgi:hypothetical protein